MRTGQTKRGTSIKCQVDPKPQSKAWVFWSWDGFLGSAVRFRSHKSTTETYTVNLNDEITTMTSPIALLPIDAVRIFRINTANRCKILRIIWLLSFSLSGAIHLGHATGKHSFNLLNCHCRPLWKAKLTGNNFTRLQFTFLINLPCLFDWKFLHLKAFV